MVFSGAVSKRLANRVGRPVHPGSSRRCGMIPHMAFGQFHSACAALEHRVSERRWERHLMAMANLPGEAGSRCVHLLPVGDVFRTDVR